MKWYGMIWEEMCVLATWLVTTVEDNIPRLRMVNDLPNRLIMRFFSWNLYRVQDSIKLYVWRELWTAHGCDQLVYLNNDIN